MVNLVATKFVGSIQQASLGLFDVSPERFMFNKLGTDYATLKMLIYVTTEHESMFIC